MTSAPRRPRGWRRPLIVSAVVVALAGVVAYAYWRTTGAGAGTGAGGSAAVLTLGPAAPTARLFPGGTTTVALTVSNPGLADVRVGSLTLDTSEGDGGFDADDDHPDCGVDALAFTAQSNGGSGWVVPAGGTLPITMPGSLGMATDADDACQGATFAVHLKVVG